MKKSQKRKGSYLGGCIRIFWYEMLLLFAILVAGFSFAIAQIDNTTTLQPSPGANDGTDNGSATAGKDASFTEAQPWGRNDGAGLEGGGMLITNSDCNIGVYPAYLQFSTANMPIQNIVKAEIQIFTWVYFNGAGWPWPVGTYQISLRRVTSSWNEMTVSRGNEPTVNSAIIDSETFTTVGGFGSPYWEFQGWMTFDITDLYKGWADGSIDNYGVKFNLDTQFCTNGDIIRILSSDYSDDVSLRPKLVVTTSAEAASIPTLNEWGLIALGLLLAGATVLMIRRRKMLDN
jgi:hypothetical protein